tara:strand:- start:929 stop:1783 length:855 start_codon:yes stop_codon:yes gene_type:complete
MAKEIRYPVYVISKGRPNSCITARSLRRCSVPFKVVVEPSEAEAYQRNQWVNSDVLVLPSDFSQKGFGSIPVRNWVWDHSVTGGHKRHWILDDNIEAFNRLHMNDKLEVRCNATFRASEDFTDRFDNVGLSGMNYYSFCKATQPIPPYYINTRIYSCILVRNNLPFRWRGKYNEDTDLSLRVLKSGECTVLFNAFLCGKVASMRMGGGNTDTVYAETDNRLEFAQSLVDQHPDIARVTKKFGRWHHHVDYKPFKKNLLKLVEGVDIPKGRDDYGMVKTTLDKKN